MYLRTEEFNPVLLKASFFSGYEFKGNARLNARTVYDYEIEYYTRSEGGVVIDGEWITYEAGDIGIRKPGQRVYGVVPYDCYLLSIDLSGEYGRKEEYILGTEEERQPCFDNPILDALPTRIPAKQVAYTGFLIKKIYEASLVQTPLEQLGIKGNLLLLIKQLAEASKIQESDKRFSYKPIKRSVEYIIQNFTKEIKISELIEESEMSKAYFHKLFQEYTGNTPNQFITQLRMSKAKYLLSVSDEEIGEIAYQCGYYDNVYFSYLFKKNEGITPTEFRRKGGSYSI